MSCTCGQTNHDASCPAAVLVQDACPTNYQHEALRSLPSRHKIRLIGVQHGKINMSVLPRGVVGAVCSDEEGQFITNQPLIPIPYLRNLVVDENGKPVPMLSGGYQEDTPPGAPSLLAADGCGRQWRWRGPQGRRSQLIWDGCLFNLIPTADAMELSDYPSVEGGACGYKEAVLVDMGGGTYQLGFRQTTSRIPGEIIAWMGDEGLIPEGMLLCDGSNLSPDAYPDLFQVLGYTMGRVDDLFKLPDLRGKFLRGVDHGSGCDPDSASRYTNFVGANSGGLVGSHQFDAFQGHAHNLTIGRDFGENPGSDIGVATDTSITADATDGSGLSGPVEAGSGSVRVSRETRPINVSVHYLIYAGCVIS